MSGWKLRYSDYRRFDIPRCYYCCCHYLKSALLFQFQYFWSLIFLDPEHQRAKGNLKYFEFQLEKQKKAAADEPPKKEEREKRDVTEKKKKPKKKPTFQLIPERKKYEMLCRGEGIRMVRERKRYTNTQFLIYKNTPWFQLIWFLLFFSLNKTPRRESRLFCRYYDNHRNPQFVLSPAKQQDEWDRPYIVRYLDVISDKEIEKVKQLAKPRVRDSK